MAVSGRELGWRVTTGALPSPLRHFLAQLDELGPGDAADMGRAGASLVELAADQDFFAPLIAQMPAGSPGVHWLIQPGRTARRRPGRPLTGRCACS
jgi:hypothetical protein